MVNKLSNVNFDNFFEFVTITAHYGSLNETEEEKI